MLAQHYLPDSGRLMPHFSGFWVGVLNLRVAKQAKPRRPPRLPTLIPRQGPCFLTMNHYSHLRHNLAVILNDNAPLLTTM